LSTALLGIYAAPPEKLDAELVFKKLFSKGKKRSVVPKGGLSQFLIDLKQKCETYGVQFVKQQVTAEDVLNFKRNGSVVFAGSFKSVRTILGTHASQIIRVQTEAEKQTFLTLLGNINLISLRKVHLAFASPPVKLLKPGLGMLIKLNHGFKSIGILFNRYITDQWTLNSSDRENTWTESWILSDQIYPQVKSFNESQLLNFVLEDRRRIFQEDSNPISHKIVFCDDAYPVYNRDLKNWLKALKPKNGFYFIGNFMGSIGLSEITKTALGIADELGSRYVSK
jgi:protoporphyrinogen oxidase